MQVALQRLPVTDVAVADVEKDAVEDDGELIHGRRRSLSLRARRVGFLSGKPRGISSVSSRRLTLQASVWTAVMAPRCSLTRAAPPTLWDPSGPGSMPPIAHEQMSMVLSTLSAMDP